MGWVGFVKYGKFHTFLFFIFEGFPNEMKLHSNQILPWLSGQNTDKIMSYVKSEFYLLSAEKKYDLFIALIFKDY